MNLPVRYQESADDTEKLQDKIEIELYKKIISKPVELFANLIKKKKADMGESPPQDSDATLRIGFKRSHGANPIEKSEIYSCLLYTSPSPRDKRQSRMPSSA